MKGIFAFAASLAFSGVYGVTVSVVAPQPGAAKSVTVANKPSAEFAAGFDVPWS